jgi:threonine dehydrogenase-like Zn-dependent dehydrogenase
MRAFLVTSAGVGAVADVPAPSPADGEVVVDVAYVGICGTDHGLFHADPERLLQTRSNFPLRLGHEWSGTVRSVGAGVDAAWLGRRVTGDTMLGCGHCARCRDGRHNLCADRDEIGVRGGRPGALAERLSVPASALHVLPDEVDDRAGAMVEPGGNAYRAVQASGATQGARVLILGSGTIGLLCAQFAVAAGAATHVLGRDHQTLELATALGVAGAHTSDRLPELAWDAVIEATDDPSMPAFAIEVAEPGRRVVFIGVSHSPSAVDSRQIVRKELAAFGVLGASQGLEPTIEAYRSGFVDPHPLIAAVIGLDDVAAALDGWRPPGAGPGPKVLVNPRL